MSSTRSHSTTLARPKHTAWVGRLLCAATLALALPSNQARAQAQPTGLPDAVVQALQQAQVPADALGAVLLPADGRGGPRWQHRAGQVMQPASTLKLLTSVVALDRLGPNLRGSTELLTRATQQDDVLVGDLVLRGGADPEFDLPQLWAMLLELRQVHGIRAITGDIVIDRTLFRPARPVRDTAPFDEWPEFAYNLVPDALQLNSHLLQIELRSDNAAAPGQVRARALPPLPGLVLDTSAMRATDRPCADWAAEWQSPPPAELLPGSTTAGSETLRLRLQGSFPKNCVQRPSLFLLDPLALAERQLRWLWASLGGEWRGRVRDADAPMAAPDQRLLARHVARPWGEVLRTLNKQSSNVYSRLLYLLLGVDGMAAAPGETTTALADRAVRQWLAEQRIAAPGLVLDNGSGLSRAERITPLALAQVLQAAHQSRWAPDLLMSLPLAGVDGTLRNRFLTGPANGNARLKTGLLRDVRALAGYVRDPQGRPWVLVAFINHSNAQAARPALDALVDWVAGGGPARAQHR